MVAFRLGPFSVAWYGIMITLGVIAATILSTIEAKRRNLDPDHVLKLVLVVLPLGIIGARLYHVIDQWAYYSQHLIEIIGGRGLGIFGALIGGAIGLIIYTKWQKLSTLQWLDIVSPGAILAQGIGRWGNFFNQELYGYPTDLPWGIYIAPENRLPQFSAYSYFQPLFFYEFLWNVLGCVFLLVAGRKLKDRLLNGDIFFLYAIWYSVGRFYLEGLKISVWTLGGLPTARWISLIAFVFSLAVIIIRHMRRRPPQKSAAEGNSEDTSLPE
jgi:phosphatidylglycerol---prolipoprotein diacylglyceryl transferase